MNAASNKFCGANLTLICLIASGQASAQQAIQLGTVQADPPTVSSLGFSIPILGGDDDYDAAATIEYRKNATVPWFPGLPLLRVRPETTSEESPPGMYGLPLPAEQFAGSVLGLNPDTDYEIRITVVDPDGGGGVQQTSARTRAVPRSIPAVPRNVAVTNDPELANAISAAQAGDVIELQAGTYAGPITIGADGTEQNPIVLRGADRDGVSIDASGSSYGITVVGSYVHVEHLTIHGSTWGARTFDSRGVVFRHNRMTNVSRGISAKSGSNRDYYICDNVLEGRFTWPDVSSNTWDEEGITISGQGHTVCHNTVSGFGDALGLANDTDLSNVAIDFFGNDVLWTGDDGLELDFAHRNVRAIGNRISNAGMGASLQPVWGGPVYVIRNQFLNLAHSPYKLNNDPSGFYIYHNTSVRSLGPGNFGGFGWPQLGYLQPDGEPAYAANFAFKNNIVIGSTQPAKVTTSLALETIDHNGWAPDGTFQFVNSWVSLADLQSSSPYEANGRILNLSRFSAPLVLAADYTTPWEGNDMTLSPTSNAVDAGERLPNVNDNFVGAAADLGALELGSAYPVYGVRSSIDTLPPAAPTNVRIEPQGSQTPAN